MRKIPQFLLLLAAWLLLQPLAAQDRYPIIPKPLQLQGRKGSFELNKKTRLVVQGDSPELELAAGFLAQLVEQAGGYTLPYGQKPGRHTITFSLDSAIVHPEGYTLEVKPKSILVKARRGRGAFLAVQTLRQLMPAAIEAQEGHTRSFAIPAVLIEDAPRFAYRGFMLDVVRHFQPIEVVKKYVDLLAFYKINTLHLHLTDDQGWRMEIKKYPRLQEVAAWRRETKIGHLRDTTKAYDGKPHGGYYTQQELKDLVQYASERFITIIPEIEMPGHARAALAAYPELGCKDSTYQVATTWGIFKDIYCPSEKTFTFLQDVLTEVMEVFPGKYIHVGGDEAPKDRWKQSPLAQELIRRHGLKDEHGLQSYFVQRIEKFLNARGRAIIGWDEILEGGLAPNATVMSWRGEKGGIAAAKQSHPVIMAPHPFMYFDQYQTRENKKVEPQSIGGFLPLDKIYNYNPVPAALQPQEARFIRGVQANLWTEYIPTREHAEQMSFPRVCALAEVAWTPLEAKNFGDFILRLKKHAPHLDALQVNYARYFLQLPEAQEAKK
ncbi:MAG: beta-N-acetylhexosaminidase [Adhaeribacter sp.]